MRETGEKQRVTAQLSLHTHRACVPQTPVCSASHRENNEGKAEKHPQVTLHPNTHLAAEERAPTQEMSQTDGK